MEHQTPSPAPAEVAFAFDKKVRKALLPHRKSAPVRAIDWLSEAGDQTQLRLLAGGVFLFGVARRDPRMIRAAVRMFAAHEVATAAKDRVKERVVRSRPRSAGSTDAKRPHRGSDTRKEKSSFPSGHAAGAFAVARAFGAVYPNRSAAAHVAAGAISLGRIPGCAHYPSDVAAGAAVGVAGSAVVTAARRLALAGLALAVIRRSGAAD